jgi:hypothetical protein
MLHYTERAPMTLLEASTERTDLEGEATAGPAQAIEAEEEEATDAAEEVVGEQQANLRHQPK